MNTELMETYDPFSEESRLRSHEIFADMRRSCPVHRFHMPSAEIKRMAANYLVSSPTDEFWSVFRYDDCTRILRDTASFSNREGPGPERMAPTPFMPDGMLLIADDPAHRRQRAIAGKAFRARIVDARKPMIQTTLDDLIDSVGPKGHADLMSEVAIPLTVAMITDFFGAGSDRRDFIARTGKAMIATMGGDAAAVDAGTEALLEQFGFLITEINQRRATLAEGRQLQDDVLSALIVAEHEGERFTDEEIGMAANQFLSAGFETTATSMCNAIWLLSTFPEERAKLQGDPSLLENAVEEVLRFESPVEGTFRTTTKPVVIGDTEIPQGAKVRLVYASANRDEDKFADAETFRIDRPLSELRRHIAFGQGVHACLGSVLARTQIQLALTTLLRRLPDIELDATNPPERTHSFTVNGFDTMPVRWDPREMRPRDGG